MTAFAMFIKPWAMLAFFAVVVIPLRLAVLRVTPRSWRPLLLSEVSTGRQAAVMAVTIFSIAMAGLLLV